MKTFLTNLFIIAFGALTIVACYTLVLLVAVLLVTRYGEGMGTLLSILAGCAIAAALFALFVWIMELIFE